MVRSLLLIKRGCQFKHFVRLEITPYKHAAISAITQSAPVRITAPGHGLMPGQRAAIVGVKGMRAINALNNPPKASDFRKLTILDADTVELNELSSADWPAYRGGGFLHALTLMDLSTVTGARMAFKERVGGAEHFRATTENGGISIDLALRRITLTLSDAETTALPLRTRLADMELLDLNGQVFKTLEYRIRVEDEVTTGDSTGGAGGGPQHWLYHGVFPGPVLDPAQLAALPRQTISRRAANLVFNCAEGRHFHLAYPAALGEARFRLGAMSYSDMTRRTVRLPDISGGETDYLLYYSNSIQYGENIPLEVL